MAHADYHCCAICDSKQEYGGLDSTTKEKICIGCLKGLREQGLNILDVSELLDWVRATEVTIVAQTLHKIGFRFCHYQNDVDEAMKAKGIGAEEGTRSVLV